MHTNEQSVYGDYRLNIYRRSGYLTQRLIVNVFSPPFFCRRLWCVACASHSSCALSPALVVVLECVYNFMSVLNRCIPFHFVSTVYRRLLSHAHINCRFPFSFVATQWLICLSHLRQLAAHFAVAVAIVVVAARIHSNKARVKCIVISMCITICLQHFSICLSSHWCCWHNTIIFGSIWKGLLFFYSVSLSIVWATIRVSCPPLLPSILHCSFSFLSHLLPALITKSSEYIYACPRSIFIRITPFDNLCFVYVIFNEPF